MGHTVYGCCCHLSACSARLLSGDSVSGVHCCCFRGADCCSSDFVVFGGGVDGSGYCSAEGAGGLCCCGLFGADDLFGDDDSGEVASAEGSGGGSNGFDGCSCFVAEDASDCGLVGVQDLIGCGGRCHGDGVAGGRCIGSCCGEGSMMGYGGCVSGGSLCGTEGGCCGDGSIFVGGSGGGCDFVGCCGVSGVSGEGGGGGGFCGSQYLSGNGDISDDGCCGVRGAGAEGAGCCGSTGFVGVGFVSGSCAPDGSSDASSGSAGGGEDLREAEAAISDYNGGCCGDGAMIGERRGVSGGGRDVRGAGDAGADGISGSCCAFDDSGSNICCDYIGCYSGKVLADTVVRVVAALREWAAAEMAATLS